MLRLLLDRAESALTGRSPKWPAVRRAHLAREPRCRACGTDQRLQVHHVRPFHLFPALELDPANLVTLCVSPSHNCHLIWGHLLDWAAYDPDVQQTADAYRARVAARKPAAA